MKPNVRKTRDSLPVSGDEVLQLQQSVFTVFNHLISVQMLHQTRQDPTHTHTHNMNKNDRNKVKCKDEPTTFWKVYGRMGLFRAIIAVSYVVP